MYTCLYLVTWTYRKIKKSRSTCITFVIDYISFTTTNTIIITSNAIWTFNITITSWKLKTKYYLNVFCKNLCRKNLLTWTCRKIKKTGSTCITFGIYDISFTTAYTITIACNTIWSLSITITGWNFRKHDIIYYIHIPFFQNAFPLFPKNCTFYTKVRILSIYIQDKKIIYLYNLKIHSNQVHIQNILLQSHDHGKNIVQ